MVCKVIIKGNYIIDTCINKVVGENDKEKFVYCPKCRKLTVIKKSV